MFLEVVVVDMKDGLYGRWAVRDGERKGDNPESVISILNSIFKRDDLGGEYHR